MSDFITFKGKIIVVIGGSSGIGRATSTLLGKLGASVIIVSRNEEKIKATLHEIPKGNHGFYCFDVSNTSDISELTSRIVDEYGAIDGLVYCVGVHGTRPLKLISPDALETIMNINILPFIEFVRCFTKKGNFNNGFGIVAVSSVSSLQGNKGKVAYSASKGAMNASVRSMARELGTKKIRVNTVVPGVVDTPLFRELMDGASGESEEFSNIIKRQYCGVIPPEHIANMIAFLLSERAMYITGAEFVVDGGEMS